MWTWNNDWSHMGSWDSWGWGIVGMLMMVLFWGGLILLVFYAIRGQAQPAGRMPVDRDVVEDHALNILRERYARGEIDLEELEARRRLLDQA